MLKNKYKDDYERVDAGQYRYVGRHFTLLVDEKRKKQYAWVNYVVAAAFFALELLAGMLNPDSSRTAWIVFPYMFLFLPMAYMMLGAYAFWGAPLSMQHSEYQNSLVRLRKSCIAILVLGGVNILLDFLFIVIHFSELHFYKEIIYLACFVGMEILGIFYGKCYDRMYAGIVIDD